MKTPEQKKKECEQQQKRILRKALLEVWREIDKQWNAVVGEKK
jgi:lipopolysaccharide biosynthesis glycosyltransferase